MTTNILSSDLYKTFVSIERDTSFLTFKVMKSLLKSGYTLEDISKWKKTHTDILQSLVERLGLTVYRSELTEYRETSEERKKKMVLLEQMTGHPEGECQHCGIRPGLQSLAFHHVIHQKDSAFRHMPKISLQRKPFAQMEEEKEICCVMCLNCHHEYHYGKNISESLKFTGSNTYHVHLDKKRTYDKQKVSGFKPKKAIRYRNFKPVPKLFPHLV